MFRNLSLLLFTLVVFSCSKSAETSEDGAAELGKCCVESMALVSQMDACCQEGISVVGELSGCCATGMPDETPDAEREECCARGKKLLDQMSPCCKKTILTGTPGDCCGSMPAELAKLGS